MAKSRRFILDHFTRNYLLIFLPFFLIVSLVFIVKISVLSSKIALDSFELMQLFGYFLPEIIFFTIPLSFIAALVNTFSKLSEDNELIALFSLGHTPKRVLGFILPSALLFSLILLTVSIFIYPQMKQKLSQFKREKTAQATLRIVPKRLSQSFGDFHIFVGSKDEKGYGDMVLFKNGEKGDYRLFIARRGRVENNGSSFILTLLDGIGESSTKSKMESLSYERLSLYQYPSSRFKRVKSLKEYWGKALEEKGRRGSLLYLLFISLTPLIVFAPAVSLSIFNPRYQKNRSFLSIFILALLVYIPAALLQKSGSVSLFAISILFFIFLNIYMLKYRIFRRY
jgi:lipopolysaccharide export system permease protein